MLVEIGCGGRFERGLCSARASKMAEMIKKNGKIVVFFPWSVLLSFPAVLESSQA